MNIKLYAKIIFWTLSSLHIAAYASDTSTDTAGQYIDDISITTRVKVAFAQDNLTNGRNIKVRTDQGVVDLTGTVSSQGESDQATELATKVTSVKAVHNNLKISSH